MFTAAELEDLNEIYQQAGVTVYTFDELKNTPHGNTNIEEPWWKVSRLPGEIPPTPFTSSETHRVLAGIKVVELCCAVAGPVIGRTLAEYGADVLKVTSSSVPDVPFFQVDGNMGKRAVDINIKTDGGRRVFEELLAEADVLIDGYRPGVLQNLGYGPATMAARAEKRGKGIIYVDENGFGHEGEWSGRPGWQQIADCLSGFARCYGEFLGRSEPTVSPLPIADSGAGCMGVIAALTGLHNRARYGGSYHGKASLMQFNLLLFAAFHATGWRIGYLIGPDHLIQYVAAAHTRICYSSVSPLQQAVAVAFEHADTTGYWEESRKDMRGKVTRFCKVFDELGIPYTDPEGGYFVLANLARVKFPNSFPFPAHIAKRRRDFQLCWFLIQTIGVVAIPPSEFYSAENAHMAENLLRFAVCKEDHVLELAKERLRALRQYLA
ncbi:hypothetical protein BBP40_006899 [Aspergillus hancockii]|nr:hypothetical protein BBP40_006899 [Aspergillus hancockii]